MSGTPKLYLVLSCIFGGTLLVAVVVLLVVALTRGTPREQDAPSSTKKQKAASRRVTPRPTLWPLSKTLMERILEKNTLCEAIALAKPKMTDERNKISVGAMMLARWMNAKRLRYEEIFNAPSTKYELVMKDSEQERGKHLCKLGRIIEIQAHKIPGGKVYHGGMWFSRRKGKVLRFVAVGSTGNLVATKRDLFCGIVIGRFSYSNSGGGTTHAVQLVGIFELKKNKSSGCSATCARYRECKKNYNANKCLQVCKEKDVSLLGENCVSRRTCIEFNGCVAAYETAGRKNHQVYMKLKKQGLSEKEIRKRMPVGSCSAFSKQ